MKRLLPILLVAVCATACTISYRFNGASIDYNVTKTITINDFPIRAALVYPPLATTFNETLKDASIESAGQALNALWISGGGCYSNFYPPTRIRSVLTDIDAVTGWALAAGILNHRLGRITGAEEWPADAPNGECIAVIDTLYSAWLAKDWAKWQQLLPSVIFQVDALAQAARKKGCDRTVIVGCGESLTVTLARKNNNPKSLLARLSPTRKLPAQHWLFQDGGRQ